MKTTSSKKNSTKKLISVLLSVAMMLSTVPLGAVISFADNSTAQLEDTLSDTMSAVHFEHAKPFVLDDSTGYYKDEDLTIFYFDEPGAYYLEDDFTLDCDLVIHNEVDLCLNGKVLNMNGNHSLTVLHQERSVFNICDCGDTVHKFSLSDDGLTWVLDEVNGTKEVIGGVITGADITTPGKNFFKAMNDTEVNIYKANIIGNRTRNESVASPGDIGLIRINGAKFNYYSGSFEGNHVGRYDIDNSTVSNALLSVNTSDLYLGKNVVINENSFSNNPNARSSLILISNSDLRNSEDEITHTAIIYSDITNTNQKPGLTDGGSIICTDHALMNLYGDIKDNGSTEHKTAHILDIRNYSILNEYGDITNNISDKNIYRIQSGTININGNVSENTATNIFNQTGGETHIIGNVTENKSQNIVSQSNGTMYIEGEIRNNGSEYAVNVSGGNSYINGTITENFCANAVVNTSTTKEVHLNGTITDNKTNHKEAVKINRSKCYIGEDLELSGNTSGDQILFETKTTVGNLIFEELPNTDKLYVDFYNTSTASFTPERAVITIDPSIDKDELASKLFGTEGVTEYVVEDGEFVYTLHDVNVEIRGAKDPTCTEPGYTGDRYCLDCQEMTQEGEEIPALGHKQETIPSVDPTCTETGLTAGIKCSVCGVILTAQEEVPANGHTGKIIPAKDATCTETGLTEGSECLICGEILVAQEEVPATGHTEEDIPAIEPTCTEVGYTAGVKCSVCGDILETPEEIPATGHTEEVIPAVEPTCTEVGYTAGVKCSVCGDILEAPEEIDAKGHTIKTVLASPADCYNPGNAEEYTECTVCGVLLSGAKHEIPALNHPTESYQINVNQKDATCTEKGYTGDIVCGLCGFIVSKGADVEPLGHTPGALENYVEATCTKEGYTGDIHCKVCGALILEGHKTPIVTVGDVHTDVNPKDHICDDCHSEISKHYDTNKDHYCDYCNEKISEHVDNSSNHKCDYCGAEPISDCVDNDNSHYCDICGKKVSECEDVDPKDHICDICKTAMPGEDGVHHYIIIDTVAATCTESAYVVHRCDYCGETHDTITGVPLGHDMVTDEAVAPTCTTPGLTEGSHCSRCDDVTTAQEEIPALGHDMVTDEAVAPTCTETGLEEGSHCSRCDDVTTAQEIIPALGHDMITDEAIAPTCTAKDFTEGSHCSRCYDATTPQEEISALGHDIVTDEAVAPTCTEPGLTEGSHCSRCDDVTIFRHVVPATGHTEEEIPAVAPTCTETGLTAGVKCSVCGDILTAQETLSAHGHIGELMAAVAPTCTNTGLTAGVKCSVCGDILTAQEAIAALGHTKELIPSVAPTCTETGLTAGVRCSVCGDILTAQNTVAALGHTASESVKENEVESTCTKNGSYDEVVYCSVCNAEISRETVTLEKKPHEYKDIVKEMNCTEDGYTLHTCEKCGHSYKTDIIPAKGHNPASIPLAGNEAVAPTCTENGKTEAIHCLDCGTIVKKSEVIPALGHDYKEISRVEPTCTSTGSVTYKCATCGDIMVKVLPKAPHNETYGRCTVCGEICGFRCGFCSKYEQMKDIPVVGLFVTFIHMIIHASQQISPIT